MAGSRVVVTSENRFPEYEALAEKAIQGAITDALKAAERVAIETETPYRKGGLRGGIHTIPVERTERGYGGAIGDSDWKARWFEKGTKAHSNSERGVRSHTAKGRARRKAAGLVSGVKAYRFLRKGIYSARPLFLEDLRRRLERIRP